MKRILTLGLLTASILSLQAEPITVLTAGNRLLTVDSATPGTVTRTVAVTGLSGSESLLGIDYRPATGQLFGLGSTSRIYAIDANSGVATPVGNALTFAVTGTRVGFDFNPVPDRIRITSDADENLRINPNDGVTIIDGPLTYAPSDVNVTANPNIVGSAYTNSFSGAQATTLYDIDSTLNTLAIQNPPNVGTLVTVGPLGVDTTDSVGFDISPTTGVAYASLTVAGVANLYTINLLSGAATPSGADPAIAATARNNEAIVDIAAPAAPGTRLRNISTRGRVGVGEDVLIAGFINGGATTGSTKYILRAIGPSLGNQGLGTPLADPVLTLFNSSGVAVATNDDFGTGPNAAAITSANLAPTNAAESALQVTLAPGSYTVQVTGKGSASGVALVEVFEQP